MLNKIITKILIIILFIINIWIINTYATEENNNENNIQNHILVTEKVPWAGCVLEKSWKDKWLYKCNVERWFWEIMYIMWKMIKYFAFLSGLLSVLTIVIWGIAYSMWWVNEAMKTKSKDFIVKSLMWLIILLLSWTILYAIAPWVYN